MGRSLGTAFDSCILIDVLNNIGPARAVFDEVYPRRLSVIARAEVLVGATDERARSGALALFGLCISHDATVAIADRAADLRRQYRLKLPDALILATALEHGDTLITRDGGFPADHPAIRRPYRLD